MATPDPAESFSADALAAVVAAAFDSTSALGDERRRDLANRIETALRTAMRVERDACTAICASRGRLWSATSERAGTPAPLAAEARARANEAAYLADALWARSK